MAASTPTTVVKLSESQERTFSVSVYAVAIALFSLFAAGAGVYQIAQSHVLSGLAFFAGAVALAVLFYGIWTMQPWRHSYGRVLHWIGIALGVITLVTWVISMITQVRSIEAVIEADYAWDVVRYEFARMDINTLPFADGVLLILLNLAGLRILRMFIDTEIERSRDQSYNNENDLLLERFFGSNSARVGGIIVLAMLFIVYIMPRVDPYHGRIVLRDGDLSHRLDPPDCVIGYIRLAQGVDEWTEDTPQPTSIFEYPCEHPFGFDKNGRDVMRRVLHGVGVSLAVSMIAVSISLMTGTLIGLSAGYMGGMLDSVLMRLMDIMLAFPSLLLAIAIVAMRGPGLENGMIAIGIVGVPVYARLARSMAISIRETEFVTATKSIGATNWRIVRSHILPNALAPLIVQGTLGLGTAVIETAALGFLGLGQQPPYPELGKMLAESREVMTSGKWWVMVFPGLAVMLIVLGFNLLGDALRDTLDPQLRGKD